jgi:hypothetical protein
MGMGQYPLGLAPMGIDPVADVSSEPPIDVPDALMFDGAQHDVPIDSETGLYKGLHWVDHQVALNMSVQLGSIPNAPDVGQTFHLIRIADEATMTRDADARIRTALATLLARRDISIVSVRSYSPVRNRVRVELTYMNNRLPMGAEGRRPTKTITNG